MLIINAIIWSVGLLFLFDNMGYRRDSCCGRFRHWWCCHDHWQHKTYWAIFLITLLITSTAPLKLATLLLSMHQLGTVEYIGVKTSRIKSLSGEQLVFANSDLTKSRIHNYKRMERRRVVYKIGVIYQTPYEQVKMIPEVD